MEKLLNDNFNLPPNFLSCAISKMLKLGSAKTTSSIKLIWVFIHDLQLDISRNLNLSRNFKSHPKHVDKGLTRTRFLGSF